LAEPESTNTMLQNSFVKIADGQYAQRTTGSGGGGAPSSVTLDPTGNTVKLDQTDPNNKIRIADGQNITIANPLAGRSTSIFANGKQAAPAAATSIATTVALAAGTWDIECSIAILGTTVANVEATNIAFQVGGVTVATPTLNVPGVNGTTDLAKFHARVNLGAPTVVRLITGAAAATAGSIYVADIVATKWENP